MIELYADREPRVAEHEWSSRPSGTGRQASLPLSAEEAARAMAVLAVIALEDEDADTDLRLH